MVRNVLRWVAVAAIAVVVGPVATAQQAPQAPQPPQPPQVRPQRPEPPERPERPERPTQLSEPVAMSFSDPSRPGTLRVTHVNGSITVRGTNRKDVSIQTRGGAGRTNRRREPEPEAAKGLKRLTPEAGPGFTFEKEDNAITISPNPWFGGRTDYEIEVPNRSNLRLTAANGGIVVEGVEGEIEVSGANGAVTMRNVTGPVMANTANGKLVAVMPRVTAQKAMAFTSFNGDVDVTLPSSTKANLRLRSDQGDVFTDFDLEIKPAPAASSGSPIVDVQVGRKGPGAAGRKGKEGVRVEVNQSIYGWINGGGPEIKISSFQGNVYVRKGP